MRGPQAGAGHPVAAGQRGPAAGAAPAGQVAGLAQLPVRGGDRGPADPQRLGQLPLGRQPHAQRQPAVGEQAADGAGQRGVVGAAAAAGQGVPLPEQPGQLGRRAPDVVMATLRELALCTAANWPPEWHAWHAIGNVIRPPRRRPAADPALRRAGPLRRQHGPDDRVRPRARPVGRVPPGRSPGAPGCRFGTVDHRRRRRSSCCCGSRCGSGPASARSATSWSSAWSSTPRWPCCRRRTPLAARIALLVAGIVAQRRRHRPLHRRPARARARATG